MESWTLRIEIHLLSWMFSKAKHFDKSVRKRKEYIFPLITRHFDDDDIDTVINVDLFITFLKSFLLIVVFLKIKSISQLNWSY